MRKLSLTTMACLLAFQINIFDGKPSFAAVNPIEHEPGYPTLSARASNVHKIFSVLNDRMTDHPLLEKTKEKVFALSDQHTQLIASLSDHVAKERKSTSGDIAFLLLTALIILL